MCKANSLYWEFCQSINKLWWQNGRGLADWLRHPAHPKVSLSRPTATGGNEVLHTKLFLRRNNSDAVVYGLLKTDWQCRPARKG